MHRCVPQGVRMAAGADSPAQLQSLGVLGWLEAQTCLHCCAPWGVGVAWDTDLPAQWRSGRWCRLSCTVVLPGVFGWLGSTSVQANLHPKPPRQPKEHYCAGKSAPKPPQHPREHNCAGKSAPTARAQLRRQICTLSHPNTPVSTTMQANLHPKPP